jgi:hypothetical protein
MKLKFELVNGFGVLIDEKIKPIKGDYFYNTIDEEIYGPAEGHEILFDDEIKVDFKILFAEPELKLEGVPVFNWRDFEVEKRFYDMYGDPLNNIAKVRFEGFIQGYKSNRAIYTHEDLQNFLNSFTDSAPGFYIKSEFKKGLFRRFRKIEYPHYVVMESEEKSNSDIEKEIGIYGHDEGLSEREFEEYKKSNSIYKFKLFTNSDGKSQGTVKELIWE